MQKQLRPQSKISEAFHAWLHPIATAKQKTLISYLQKLWANQ